MIDLIDESVRGTDVPRAFVPGQSAALPCHLVAPDVFFAEAPAEIEYAKTLCRECPVRAGCLDGALARREACGVWGGELIVNGAVVARKRPRGRPRKEPLPVAPAPPATPEIGRSRSAA